MAKAKVIFWKWVENVLGAGMILSTLFLLFFLAYKAGVILSWVY
jgi:hypothetical protein